MQVSNLLGIGEKRTNALNKAGIFSVADLLNHFPRDYDDRSNIKTVSELTPDMVNTIRGVVAFEPENAELKRKGINGTLTVTKVKIKDSTGILEITWFNQPYLKKYFKKGNEYIFTGMVKNLNYGSRDSRLQMTSPDYEVSGGNELSGGRIVPIYTPPKQFSQKIFRSLIFQALEVCEKEKNTGAFFEYLPFEIRKKYDLCPREEAVLNIHFPKSDELFLEARRRLVFEELFFMQLTLLNIKGAVSAEPGLPMLDVDFAPFLHMLPFSLTNAQGNVLREITADISSGSRLNRLVQGDVGSGKTAVAMASAYLAIKNGYQAVMMAPTDVLANQLYAGFSKFFEPFGFEVVLLTGSLKVRERRVALAKIENGQANMIIGTHALIQPNVVYLNLGLAITDEQHRFGVNQRLNLTRKGGGVMARDGSEGIPSPHTLVMTATPIPRTLGLILYGDLDISIINELPPGRKDIKTYKVDSGYRERIFGFIRKEVEKGQQVYVICPAIQEQEETASSQKAELKNVLEYTGELKKALPNIVIDFLHGKMKPVEKDEIMAGFKAGEIQVLVSTTVIEVGVHVDNATLMIIENAERFGLSQLHQLRGRVGRSDLESYCVLITDSKNKQTKTRMKAMTDTADGFKLAEIDLQERGYGDFFGTRQHGLPSFMIANLYRDAEILNEVQEAVKSLKQFNFADEEGLMLKSRIEEITKIAELACM